MKTTRSFLALLAVALLAVGPARAATETKPADARPVLHVSVVEPINPTGNAYTDFDRFAEALEYVARQRQWPVKIDAARLAGNVPDYPSEVRVTLQAVRQEPIEEYVLRAWVILMVDGRKQDFGVITARYNARMGQNYDDLAQQLFRVGAAAIADKLEPALFPELKKK